MIAPLQLRGFHGILIIGGVYIVILMKDCTTTGRIGNQVFETKLEKVQFEKPYDAAVKVLDTENNELLSGKVVEHKEVKGKDVFVVDGNTMSFAKFFDEYFC